MEHLLLEITLPTMVMFFRYFLFKQWLVKKKQGSGFNHIVCFNPGEMESNLTWLGSTELRGL